MNIGWVIIGLILMICGFSFAYPVQVTSQIGNVFTVSLFASFLRVNIQPEIWGWGIFVFGFLIAIHNLFENPQLKKNEALP